MQDYPIAASFLDKLQQNGTRPLTYHDVWFPYGNDKADAPTINEKDTRFRPPKRPLCKLGCCVMRVRQFYPEALLKQAKGFVQNCARICQQHEKQSKGEFNLEELKGSQASEFHSAASWHMFEILGKLVAGQLATHWNADPAPLACPFKLSFARSPVWPPKVSTDIAECCGRCRPTVWVLVHQANLQASWWDLLESKLPFPATATLSREPSMGTSSRQQ